MDNDGDDMILLWDGINEKDVLVNPIFKNGNKNVFDLEVKLTGYTTEILVKIIDQIIDSILFSQMELKRNCLIL